MNQPSPIPDGYHSVQPYLIFAKCQEAMHFYSLAFQAREIMCMKSPANLVQHAEMQIGDSRIMMADESPQMEAYGPRHYGGSPISLMLYTADCDATYAQALAAGGRSLREPTDQSYGDRMAGIEDPFGYKWWIGTPLRNMSATVVEQANSER